MMHNLIREELGGIGLAGCRADLVRRLDYVLSELDREGVDSFHNYHEELSFPQTKQKYEAFRRELLELDREAVKILAGM